MKRIINLNLKWLIPFVLFALSTNVWGTETLGPTTISITSGWTNHAGTTYCSGWGKNTGWYASDYSITALTNVLSNASNSNFSLTIRVKALCNQSLSGYSNSLSVILLNSSNETVGSASTVTGLVNSSNSSSATWKSFSFTPTSAVTGYKIYGGKGCVVYSTEYTLTYDIASCNANPSATGNASFNGSFTLTSLTDAVSVSSGTWGPGSNCAWIDYGFVWGTSSSPTVDNNKVQIGTSGNGTSWTTDGSNTAKQVKPSGSTSPTAWVVGTPYYVKAYGKNGKTGATFYYSTTAASFTLRSITYNSNGGTTVNTQYVNSGGTYSAPTAPTKTGYTFGGWYTDNGTFANAMDWSSAISENKALYAKWTAKTTTVSFNQNSGTGGQTSNLTATYGSAMPAISGTPTREGYDFGGYYDGSGGTGTKYYNADGSSATNWDKENSTWTLYAKWTVKSYSVTWKVNNTNYSAGGSTSVNHGSRVATLPTAPDPGDYCGDKFVGWTTDAEYVHNTSPLFTAAGSAPVADGAQIFYAVFADYDD